MQQCRPAAYSFQLATNIDWYLLEPCTIDRLLKRDRDQFA